MLLKVEKRCQTTIEKILKSIVDERRSPNLLAARIYVLRPRPGEQGKIVASDRQLGAAPTTGCPSNMEAELEPEAEEAWQGTVVGEMAEPCLLYTSPSPRDPH